MQFSKKKYLLSSPARVQAPWIKVTIGDYTFGVFDRATRNTAKSSGGFYTLYKVKYPNYVKSLNIIKINGQVNQYTLQLVYPIRDTDDPNFFEKVFSSVSSTRKIVFSYGDASMPAYVYKDEEAIITKVSQTFALASSTITYTVSATSGAALNKASCNTFTYQGKYKPSSLIKKILTADSVYHLYDTFTGMKGVQLEQLIAGDDAAVEIEAKTNISTIDYINYLVSCMIPQDQKLAATSDDVYIMTIHDDTIYDQEYANSGYQPKGGPYFTVKRTSQRVEQSDAYVVDVGYNTSTIVTDFSIENNENYSLMYDYQEKLQTEEFSRRLDANGNWVDVYSPTITSRNDHYMTRAEDKTWWAKITKYPVSASITIQGLLRPATLMSYLRLNVIFPGGHKHMSSGLYLITKQVDNISESGYKTTLSLTKISGDNEYA